MTPWSASACEVDPLARMLADTAPVIGATTLAFSAMARSMGAAPSIARSMSAARSRIETTSLSGSAVTPSVDSSSGVNGANWSVLIRSPSWRPARRAGVLPRPVLPVLGPPPVLAIGPFGPASPMTRWIVLLIGVIQCRPEDSLASVVAPPSGGLPCRLDIGLYPVATRGKHAVLTYRANVSRPRRENALSASYVRSVIPSVPILGQLRLKMTRPLGMVFISYLR